MNHNQNRKVNFNSFIPVSTCDWYGRASSVIFFNECNFRCKYCHNKQTWSEINIVDIDTVKNKIKSSLPFVSAITFSGGEPYIQFNALKELINYSKSIGLDVAVETNGYFTEEIEKIEVDVILVDIKAPIYDNKKYAKITGISNASEKVIDTLNLSLPIEIRIVENVNTLEIEKSLKNYNYPIRKLPYNSANN